MGIADVIALVALFIALQGGFLWFYQRTIDSVVKTHTKEIETMIRGKILLEKNHAAFTNCLAEHASMSRLYSTLLVRAHSVLSPAIAPTVSKEIARYDFDLQRSLHELDLFSSDSTRRESAMRKLAEEFGDLGSLDLLRQCASELYMNESSSWKLSIAQLERRISSMLTGARNDG
jgi:hypothetical protein